MKDYYLVKVGPEYYESIKEYRKQMLLAGSSMDGTQQLAAYEDIEKWALNNALFESEDSLPPGYSIGFEYLYVHDGEVVGMVNIRPKAMEHINLKNYGGHIGYSVKPSYRNKGIGTAMLKDTLLICKRDFDLDEVLITCLKDNIASRKVILNNNGIYESDIYYAPEEKYLERYWIKL